MSRKKIAVISLLALLAAVYAGGIYYYNGRVFPRTILNGEEVSGVFFEEAAAVAEEKALQGNVTAQVRDQYFTIPRKDVLRVENHEEVLQAAGHGTAYTWPAEYLRDHDIRTEVRTECDPVRAEETLRSAGMLDLDIPAVDAVLSDYREDGGYQVIPDADGWHAPMEDLIGVIAEAAKNEPQTMDITDLFAVKAEVAADDADLLAQASEKNRLVGRAVPITCGDLSFELSGAELNGWLRRNSEGILGIDTDKLRAFADDAAEKCREEAEKETTGEIRYIAARDNLAARLAENLGLSYQEPETEAEKNSRERANEKLLKNAEKQANRTSDEAEKARILAEAEAKVKPEPEMVSIPLELFPEADAAPDIAADNSAEEPGEKKNPEDGITVELLEASPEFEEGYGLDYVDVSIENQHVRVFENARLIMETDCVTGTPNKARMTHPGVFHIYAMQRNRILRGRERLYESFVNYWMPFDEGIGLHDATWRGSFGGNIYKSSGSHGCVNLPLSFAKELYSHVYVGETVYVH